MSHIKKINSSIIEIKRYIEKNRSSSYQNIADRYLPIGPQTPNEHSLDWSRVKQALIESLFQLSIEDKDKENLREEIKASFRSSRDTRELVDIIDELYLSNNAINSITPLAYLESNKDTLFARTKTMINIVQGLMKSPLDTKPNLIGNNLLESLLIEKVHELCQFKVFDEKRTTYLPFLADLFSKDIKTLSENPSYFLSELENYIHLYIFIYLTQLTIHLGVPSNRYTKPAAKQLYFILETERASRERHECNQYGYDYLFSKSRGLALGLFPILGYFGHISEHPCWELAVHNEDENFIGLINEFNKELSTLFGESYQYEVSLQDALNKGVALQNEIFKESLNYSVKGSRKGRNQNVVNTFQTIFGASFISDRKAAGKYFVLNSNMLLLLTNLVIEGSSENKLLIDDVIEGFKQRGIWLDIKSKKALLKFYENVGNIEKLSDSGDAVYVKTTI